MLIKILHNKLNIHSLFNKKHVPETEYWYFIKLQQYFSCLTQWGQEKDTEFRFAGKQTGSKKEFFGYSTVLTDALFKYK